jgi:RND family efflux transporter MFP subunit
MSRRLLWAAVALLLLGVLALAVMRGLRARAAVPDPMQPARPAAIELLDVDLVTVQQRALPRTLPVTGAIKAVNVAQLKAKVPGEVKQLLVREGEPVRRGQLVARIDPSDYVSKLAQARNGWLAAQGQVDIAQRNYDNNKSLVDQNFISRTALDNSLNNLEVAKANAAAAKAALDMAEKSLADTAITSPIDGVVSQRFVQPGEKVGQDARIVEVVDLSQLELEAPVPADDVAQVAVGQAAEITPDGMDAKIAATVARIAPSTVGTSRNILVYLRLQPKGEALRQGMFAKGVIRTGSNRELLAAPLSAVRVDEPQPYVWLLDGDLLRKKRVGLGERSLVDDDTLVQITSGVSAGSRILRGGISSVQDGVPVKITALPKP